MTPSNLPPGCTDREIEDAAGLDVAGEFGAAGSRWLIQYGDKSTEILDEEGEPCLTLPGLVDDLDLLRAIMAACMRHFEDGKRVGRGSMAADLRRLLGVPGSEEIQANAEIECTEHQR